MHLSTMTMVIGYIITQQMILSVHCRFCARKMKASTAKCKTTTPKMANTFTYKHTFRRNIEPKWWMLLLSCQRWQVASHIHIQLTNSNWIDIEVAERMGAFSLPNRFEIECTEYYQHLTPDSVHRKNAMWNA